MEIMAGLNRMAIIAIYKILLQSRTECIARKRAVMECVTFTTYKLLYIHYIPLFAVRITIITSFVDYWFPWYNELNE